MTSTAVWRSPLPESQNVTSAPQIQLVGRVPFGAHDAGVNRHMPVNADDTVDVGGSVDCPAGTPAHIHFRLVQPSTGAAAEGDWFGTCAGEGPSRAHRSRTWVVEGIESSPGTPFAPGTGRSGAMFTGRLLAGDIDDPWSGSPINLVPAD